MTLTEETYEELNYLLREIEWDEPPLAKIVIASGEDLFNEHWEHLYVVS